jgi:hypothetical protein
MRYWQPVNPKAKGVISKRPEQPSHTLCRPAAIILGVAKPATTLRAAQQPTTASQLAQTIARAVRLRPPHPHSDHQRDFGALESRHGTATASNAIPLPKYTVLVPRAISLITKTRYDASTTRLSTTT